MKNLKKLLCASLFVGLPAFAGDVLEDFDKLGGNEALLEKAKALEPETSVTVVQDRLVNRKIRFEFMPEAGLVLGGDPYVNTKAYGLDFQFHINPYISLGAKWNTFGNKLSAEGNNLISNSGNTLSTKYIVPDIDYAKDQLLGIVNIYPFYGKLKIFNSIAHFDVYGLLGYGNTNLNSGSKKTVTGGAGVGFWVNNHMTIRWELRYENYKALSRLPEHLNEDNDMNLTISSLQVGLLL